MSSTLGGQGLRVHQPFWAPKNQNTLQGLNLGGFDYMGQAKQAAANMNLVQPPKLPKAGGLSAGQATLGGIGAGLEALNLGLGIWNQISAQKLADEQLKLAKTQLDKENTRWENREDERKKNNEAIAASANALVLPTERY